MIYEIAGLKIEMEPRFRRLKRQSEDYASSGTPVMQVKPNPQDAAGAGMYGLSESDREYFCCNAVFSRGIVAHGRFFLHASAVVYEGAAYLFSGPSGVGKSTHTSLWRELYPESYILNDDKPVIWPEHGRITAWGSPFSGKTDLQKNRGVPVKAICFLKQGGENRIRPLAATEAMAMMLSNTWRPQNSPGMERLLDMVQQVAAGVRVFELCCAPEREAAELSCKVMKGM